MFRSLLLTTVLLTSTLVHATAYAARGVANPSADTKYGKISGFSKSGVDRFLGIPYVQAPTGDRRLREPQAITTNFGTLDATTQPPSCAPRSNKNAAAAQSQFKAAIVAASPNTTAPAPSLSSPKVSEDCLYLNVERPSGFGPNASLPVVVWIYGGGFQSGSSSLYDGSSLVQQGVNLQHPFIYVTFNYRLAALGFLAGKEITQEGNTNLGLKDQRAALQWVSDNIGAFGGDPDKVTIWGESAGAWSVTDHTLVNGGDISYKGRPLFRGVIADSGASYPALNVTSPTAQGFFDLFVQGAGCGNSTDKLACLRALPFSTLVDAQDAITVPSSSINFGFGPRPDTTSKFFSQSPEDAVRAGKFAKVPVITVNQQDEGTYFASHESGPFNSDASLVEFLQKAYPTAKNSTLASLVSLYPASPDAGSPYNTGIFNERFPGYKRLAAISGDLLFLLQRRIYLDTISSQVKVWSGIGTYDSLLPYYGTTHSTDVYAYFYGLASPVAVDQIRKRYISFINYADPNKIPTPLFPAWPQYDTVNRSLLDFGALSVSVTPDNFRDAAYRFLKANLESFRA